MNNKIYTCRQIIRQSELTLLRIIRSHLRKKSKQDCRTFDSRFRHTLNQIVDTKRKEYCINSGGMRNRRRKQKVPRGMQINPWRSYGR